MRRKALKTILVVTVIAIAHFAASFYVSHKIGTIAGTLVSETLINASEVNEISADVTDQMSQELKETSGSWIKMSYVLAFPVGLFTIPLKDNLMQQHILKPIIENGTVLAFLSERTELMDSNQKLRLLTLKEAAEYLRMHKGSLYRLLESGKIDIPAIKLGGKWLFNLDSLNQYLMMKEQDRN